MNERELIKKLHQENKKFRTRAKNLEGERSQVLGAALLREFIVEVNSHGVYLERAILTCDMAMGIGCLSIDGSKVLNDKESEDKSRDLFKKAARLQKQLMPFVETHFKFATDTESHFKPEALKEFLGEMQQTDPLLEQAESLNAYCINWRHRFATGLNDLYEQQ
jgi:hypothetical protein